jgi:hypothetical protein
MVMMMMMMMGTAVTSSSSLFWDTTIDPDRELLVLLQRSRTTDGTGSANQTPGNDPRTIPNVPHLSIHKKHRSPV